METNKNCSQINKKLFRSSLEKLAICRQKYDANVKNVIAKKSLKVNQLDYSDRALRDEKNQLV